MVVADATPLIYLAAIKRFSLLGTLYGRIAIPPAVFSEVVLQGTGRWGAQETANANWIDVRKITDLGKLPGAPCGLHAGEAETVALADELGADLTIMDDSAGRRELAARKPPFIGTAGVLMQAKHQQLLPALRPELDQLRGCGFDLSDRVYQACLAGVGE
jgi:uncharacterized protein